MGWTAHRTPRNTLHVVNDDDGTHFEAADEQEAQDNIAAIGEAREAAERAKQEAEQHANDFTGVVGDAPTLRVN